MRKRRYDDHQLRDRRRKQVLRRIRERECQDQWTDWKNSGGVRPERLGRNDEDESQ
jgi:hypothetical protein